MRQERLLHGRDAGSADRQPGAVGGAGARPQVLYAGGRLQLRPYFRGLGEGLPPAGEGRARSARIHSARRGRFRLGHSAHRECAAERRVFLAGRRQPHRLLPAVRRRGSEQENPDRLADFRSRQRADRSEAGGGRGTDRNLSVLPGARQRDQQEVGSRLASTVRRRLSHITDSANTVWNGWHLWAMAANKAGSLEPAKVIAALESGLSFDAPEGKIRLDPQSHHVVHTVNLAKVNDKKGLTIFKSIENVEPSDTKQVCDLIGKPDQHTQYTPKF